MLSAVPDMLVLALTACRDVTRTYRRAAPSFRSVVEPHGGAPVLAVHRHRAPLAQLRHVVSRDHTDTGATVEPAHTDT